ncbi:hypothetical protein [Sphingomonas morindae]|uniref:Monooxygenase n=1 Tax=Sphingomonas morindae TaxID=1541170 RepID=A0ABY4XA81_9SPHN|nr:hypothetical protein [Sphingomonas morindae]USI73729.1 hypothetical protein LHA26_04455 [Sphingomonas morindae]
MIAEIVTYSLAAGSDAETALDIYRRTSRDAEQNIDLVRSFPLFDAERGLAGGIFLWRSREAAERAHGESYWESVRALAGAYPEIETFDLLPDDDLVDTDAVADEALYDEE